MTCCIEVTAYLQKDDTYTEEKTVQARLLTDEIRRLIERQNIDCSDINCMKWPLKGMSRHATCKLLLLKSDFFELFGMPNLVDMFDWKGPNHRLELDPNRYREFRIWFKTAEAVDQTTHFSRMHLAKITPLVFSHEGIPRHMRGEMLYLVEFRCVRWARRSVFPFEDEQSPILSWGGDTYAQESYLSYLGPKKDSWKGFLKRDFFGPPLIRGVDFSSESYTKHSVGVRNNDIYVDASIPNAYDEWPLFRLNAATDSPWGIVVDDYAFNDFKVIGFYPAGTPLVPGQYATVLHGIPLRIEDAGANDKKMWDFVEAHTNDIIAGSVYGVIAQDLVTASFPKIQSLVHTVPSWVFRHTTGHCAVRARYSTVADGMVPRVFSETPIDKQADPLLGSTPGVALPYVGLDMTGNQGRGWVTSRGFTSIDMGSCGRSRETLEMDIALSGWEVNTPDKTNENYVYDDGQGTPEPTSGAPWGDPRTVEYMDGFAKWRRMSQYNGFGACDLWLRGWIMPTYEEAWIGAMWVELRLQTDEKGFGFPTTRIYGDLEDPMLVPQPSDGKTAVIGSGMIQTWKGMDGKTRVHMQWPFGIPCLVAVVGNERIAAGVDAWKYKVVPVGRKGNYNTVQTITDPDPSEFNGGIENLNRGLGSSDPDLVAFNLAEIGNTAGFTAPGYKKPLAQAGFSVLPIGQNRDGDLQAVVVQGMIYRGHDDPAAGEGRACVYFCMPNAIDGECA